MRPMPSVLVLSGLLAAGWAGSGVGQEQQNPLQIFKDALKTAQPPKTGAPGEPAAGAYESLVTSDAPSALPGRGLEKAPPDIGGVRLGMSPEEVHAVLSKRYPGRKIDVTKYDLYISTAVGPPVGQVLESFSMGLNELSSMSTSLMAFPMPGTMPSRSFMLPIFLICCSWVRKSLKSNWFLRIFFCSRAASSWSNVSCAFSTRLTTSPMPRMRPAMRSG